MKSDSDSIEEAPEPKKRRTSKENADKKKLTKAKKATPPASKDDEKVKRLKVHSHTHYQTSHYLCRLSSSHVGSAKSGQKYFKMRHNLHSKLQFSNECLRSWV